MKPRLIDLLKRAQASAPVNVDGLAEDLGLAVRKTWLDDDISGEIVRAQDRYEVNLNARDAETRQRFTLAHEIGHFLYHRDLIGDGLDDDRAYRSTNKGRYFNTRIGPTHETEANKFAANLLMPWPLIEEMQALGLSRKQMAARLKVSEHAMAIRLGESYP